MRSHFRGRAATALVITALGLVLSACASSASPASTAGIRLAALPAGTTCQAVHVGVIIRCENFYTAYWPTISANLTKLYRQALRTDGGHVVIWDWYALSSAEIAAFTRQFPGLKVQTRGLQYNLSSAVMLAKASGSRNSDIVKGSIVTMTQAYDHGFWAKVDWTKFGVPKQFLQIGGTDTGMLPDSANSPLLDYNSSEVSDLPVNLQGFLQPRWKHKMAIANYGAQNFTGYGMKSGRAAMVSLIKSLKRQGVLTVTADPDTLLSSGDDPVVLGGQLFDPNPALQVAPIRNVNMYVQFIGVNTDASNVPGAELFSLWSAYDPAWLKTALTAPTFDTLAMPYPGLPTATFAQATGLLKKNFDVWLAMIKNNWGIFETWQNRDKYNRLIAAANTALNG